MAKELQSGQTPKVYILEGSQDNIYALDYQDACRQAFYIVQRGKDISFKDFLKLYTVKEEVEPKVPAFFGAKVLVSGKPASLLERRGDNSFLIWLEGSTSVNTTHELDVSIPQQFLVKDPIGERNGSVVDHWGAGVRFVFDMESVSLVSAQKDEDGNWVAMPQDEAGDLEYRLISALAKRDFFAWEAGLETRDEAPEWALSVSEDLQP